MLLMGPHLFLADPEHTTITTSSIARSSMEVNRCGMARKVMFEPRSTHQVDKSMSAFAATVSYWSRTPRLQQRWMPQSILVAGGSCAHLAVNSLVSACCWVMHRAAQEPLVSSNAVSYGSRLRTTASWVRVLAFAAVARRESYSIDSGELPTEEWTVRSSKFAVTTGKG